MLGKAHFYHEAIKRAVSVFGTMFNEIDIMIMQMELQLNLLEFHYLVPKQNLLQE